MGNHKNEPTKATAHARQFCGDNNMAQREHAGQFQPRSGDECVDPTTRPKWPRPRTHLPDIALADRHRNGRCINCDD